MDLQTPLSKISRPLKMYAGRLEKLGIVTVSDLLYHVPHRYDDFSLTSSIARLQPGEIVTVKGTVLEIKNEYTRRAKPIQKALVVDDTGSITVTWFNQPFLTRVIKPNMTLALSGKVEWFGKTKTLTAPSYEILSENGEAIHTGRLVPIYPETAGVTSKWLRRQIYMLLSQEPVEEYLPEDILKKNNLIGLPKALQTVHFPETLEDAESAKNRLAFDELLFLQMKATRRRREWEVVRRGHVFKVQPFQKEIDLLWENLPFSLTLAQRNASHAIFQDLEKEKPMNRLLQGDVGSGKTVVAAAAMYLAFLNDYQSVLMAPTEILAQQHFKTVSGLLEPLGVKVDLVTGSKKYPMSNVKYQIHTNNDKGEKKKLVKLDIVHLAFDILVGTHAVLYEQVQFTKLGLVVIDEQQRFGVEQRSLIRQKGDHPHVLTMTATPIPRTVALTIYGDLDLSYLNEMPKGRKIVKTWLVPTIKRNGAYEWIRKQIKEAGSQAFIICPFIEQSETMQTVKAASVEYERLKNEVFPDLNLGLLHGKMKTKEKDDVLLAFREKQYDILVATPVVEVGIDIPNATVILIEAAERFGLAQLHQLRGRVGRGEKQSFCLLFTESTSDMTINKLKALETTYVGAQLAELDLRLRGPGELYGTLQSGIPELKVASFSDVALIQRAKRAADELYPKLTTDKQLQKAFSSLQTTSVSPD